MQTHFTVIGTDKVMEMIFPFIFIVWEDVLALGLQLQLRHPSLKLLGAQFQNWEHPMNQHPNVTLNIFDRLLRDEFHRCICACRVHADVFYLDMLMW